ncbi:hypothetical protein BYT27DRAFT_7200885 [Phlegmacium glaucopus]|nr:hypothetical protein BYT27DRAFT_7200885 [Phlegmacium glaucopus]
MRQPFDSGDELSLRHLPDVSDSSFSFQIPGAIRGDNLLADNDLDFFKGADVSIAPLASPPTTAEPLFTLSQLTPKSKAEKLPSSKDGRKLGSFPTLSYDHSKEKAKADPHGISKVTTTNANVLPKPKSKVQTTSSTVTRLPSCEGSPAAVRLDILRVELNMLNDNLLAGPSVSLNHQELPMAVHRRPKGILKKSLEKKRPQRISPRNNQKVIGISKTRCASKLSSATSRHLDGTDSLPNQQEQNTATADLSQLLSQQAQKVNGDLSFADSSMTSAAGGVAGRLVMYSEKLINSFGLFDPDRPLEPYDASQTFISQDQEAGTDIQAQVPYEADKPLTLSQLSPQKAVPSRNPTPTPRENVPMSPLRLATKRPVSVASDVLQKRKKCKIDTSSAEVSVLKPNAALKARLPSTKRHPKPIPSNSGSKLRLNDRSTERKPTSTRVDGPGIRRLPVFKPQGPELNGGGDNSKDTRAATSASSSRCTTSKVKESNKKVAEPVVSITLNNKGQNVGSSDQGSSRAAYHAAATRPVPFNFQTDRRGPDAHKDRDQDKSANDPMERSESQKEKRLHSSTTIPDFKAMHAAQEAELALRKENIQPVVPLPIRWETDLRLKERQKFDERMREKEREQERLMELRRKEREEEEEREVRELRKKAVPKAHEVPGWYKEAPKKKKDIAMVGSIGMG